MEKESHYSFCCKVSSRISNSKNRANKTVPPDDFSPEQDWWSKEFDGQETSRQGIQFYDSMNNIGSNQKRLIDTKPRLLNLRVRSSFAFLTQYRSCGRPLINHWHVPCFFVSHPLYSRTGEIASLILPPTCSLDIPFTFCPGLPLVASGQFEHFSLRVIYYRGLENSARLSLPSLSS